MSGAAPFKIENLLSPEPTMRDEALMALQMLSSEARAILIQEGIASHIIAMFAHPDVQIQMVAALTIQHLVKKQTTEAKLTLINAGVVLSLLSSSILRSSDERTQKILWLTILALYTKSLGRLESPDILNTLTSEVFRPWLEILKAPGGTTPFRENICIFLDTCFSRENRLHKKTILAAIDADIFFNLQIMLGSPDYELSVRAAFLIDTLLKDPYEEIKPQINAASKAICHSLFARLQLNPIDQNLLGLAVTLMRVSPEAKLNVINSKIASYLLTNLPYLHAMPYFQELARNPFELESSGSINDREFIAFLLMNIGALQPPGINRLMVSALMQLINLFIDEDRQNLLIKFLCKINMSEPSTAEYIIRYLSNLRLNPIPIGTPEFRHNIKDLEDKLRDIFLGTCHYDLPDLAPTKLLQEETRWVLRRATLNAMVQFSEKAPKGPKRTKTSAAEAEDPEYLEIAALLKDPRIAKRHDRKLISPIAGIALCLLPEMSIERSEVYLQPNKSLAEVEAALSCSTSREDFAPFFTCYLNKVVATSPALKIREQAIHAVMKTSPG